jgi:hypothetical protein
MVLCALRTQRALNKPSLRLRIMILSKLMNSSPRTRKTSKKYSITYMLKTSQLHLMNKSLDKSSVNMERFPAYSWLRMKLEYSLLFASPSQIPVETMAMNVLIRPLRIYMERRLTTATPGMSNLLLASKRENLRRRRK